jgi:hypothetical protein
LGKLQSQRLVILLLADLVTNRSSYSLKISENVEDELENIEQDQETKDEHDDDPADLLSFISTKLVVLDSFV